MNKKIFDRYGTSLRKGDTVQLIDLPLELFLGRTENEQNILRAEIGKTHLIQSCNPHGKLKLDFYDVDGIPHSVLISTSCVKRIPG